MARVPVFYSFHFDNDVFRVQQIRNMGVIDGDEPVSANEWEQIKRRGDSAVKKWIDDNMAYRRCVIVLVGAQTADRPWVHYEIKKAYNEKKGLFGIYIHNLNCLKNGRCAMGPNPFDRFTINNGATRLSSVISCYEPGPDAYKVINASMQSWVDVAVTTASMRRV
jgi:hypothetical protein